MLDSQIAAEALDQVEAANVTEDFEAISKALDTYHAAVAGFRAPADEAELRRWAAIALKYEQLTGPLGETGTENALASAVLKAVAANAN